jgi:hypothetical protein
MIARNVFQLVFKILLYLGIYFLVASHLHAFNLALCFSYTAAILLLPIGSNAVRTLIFAFAIGFLVDMFHSTPGIHTSACVLMAFFRANFLNWMVPAGGYEEYMTITIPSMGLKWFFPYMFGLLFLHHFLYFLIDYSSFAQIGMVFLKTILSTMFTFVSIVLIQFGLEPPKRVD